VDIRASRQRQLGELMCDMTHAEYEYTLQHTKALLWYESIYSFHSNIGFPYKCLAHTYPVVWCMCVRLCVSCVHVCAYARSHIQEVIFEDISRHEIWISRLDMSKDHFEYHRDRDRDRDRDKDRDRESEGERKTTEDFSSHVLICQKIMFWCGETTAD